MCNLQLIKAEAVTEENPLVSDAIEFASAFEQLSKEDQKMILQILRQWVKEESVQEEVSGL